MSCTGQLKHAGVDRDCAGESFSARINERGRGVPRPRVRRGGGGHYGPRGAIPAGRGASCQLVHKRHDLRTWPAGGGDATRGVSSRVSRSVEYCVTTGSRRAGLGVAATEHRVARARHHGMAPPDVLFKLARSEARRILGFVAARILRSTDAYVLRLCVHPDYQRRVIGSELFDAVVEAFSESATIRFDVEERNQKAISFWRKHGFRETGSKEVAGAGVRIRLIEMARALARGHFHER